MPPLLARSSVIAVLAFLVIGVPLQSQTGTGTITGILTDDSGGTIAEAKIAAQNAATGVTSTSQSNRSGNYSIPNLIPGIYSLTADAPGFKHYTGSEIRVQVGETLRLDLRMQVGSLTESVNVVAEVPLVQTETGSLGQVVDNRKVTQLPLIGRNVYSLTNLVPGASTDQSGRTRINGSRSRANEYLVDGVTQVIPETRTANITPPPIDSIEEFKILTSAYSAEYGNGGGALVNVATKSGTNALHGTLWEFLRNDKLNTRNFFSPANARKPVLRQNQFGVAGGGPVVLPKIYDGRNRTFFFGDFEGRRVRQERVFTVDVPTTSARSGDFSQFLGPQIGTDTLGRPVRQGQIYDPFSQRTENGQVVRDPFENNLIPRSRFDPAALKLLDFYPSPTSGALSANLVSVTPTGSDLNRYDLRGDHNLGSNDKMFARFSNLRTDNLSSSAFPASAGAFDSQGSTERTVAGTYVKTVSPSQLNELRVSYLYRLALTRPYLADRNIAAEVGIPNIDTVAGIPNISISGIQEIATTRFSGGPQRVLSFIDNYSIIQGRHTIKFGGEARLYRLTNFQPRTLPGRFDFVSAQTSLPGSLQARTGNAFASFLLGTANQTQYTQKDPGQEVNNETFSMFVQDDFKVNRRVTINVGLRYELNTRLEDARGFHSTFDLEARRVLAGDAKPSVALDKNNFGPRFGFAFDLFGNQRTVLRGGYGIFHQAIQGSGGDPLSGVVKFPFEFTSNSLSPNGIDPVARLSQGPVRQQEFDASDPRLGFGTIVQIQNSNLAPYVQQWNFGLDQTLGRDTVVGAAYVGTAGKKLDGGRSGYINLNQVPIEVAQRAGREQNTLNPNTAGLRPYPEFNEVQQLLPRYGDSNYHSLQLKLERQYAAGLSYLLAYTWSKSIDNTAETFNFSGGSWPQDVYNLRAERGLSSADVPHRFSGAYVYDLPFGKDRAIPLNRLGNAIAGGWQLSGIATLSSGRPFDVEQATNTSGTFSLLQRPNINGNPNLPRNERSVDRFFDASVFSAAVPLTFGTSPRNPVRGPGLINFDAAVNKDWTFRESGAVELRFEAFNFTNTPPFQLNTRAVYNPNLPLERQTFGRLTSAGDGRVLQIALKVKF